jgi:hypothetical protein
LKNFNNLEKISKHLQRILRISPKEFGKLAKEILKISLKKYLNCTQNIMKLSKNF